MKDISILPQYLLYTNCVIVGMLDHIVAGGLPHGITPMDNVIKECEEEASIPEDLARLSKATGE